MRQDYALIQYVHSDFTESYGSYVRAQYQRIWPGATEALRRAGLDGAVVDTTPRFLILKFLRNIDLSVRDLPIVFCGAQSVPVEDVFAIHVHKYAE